MNNIDNQTLLNQAIRNNAEWCDIVCRSHNLKGVFTDNFWLIKSDVPKYYPNVITLAPTTNSDKTIEFLEDFTSNERVNWSVKDSFAELDLMGIGFSKLFDASWIKAPRPNLEILNNHEVSWKIIARDEDLISWETAWSDSTSSGLFKPVILENTFAAFIAAYKDNEIVAGAIANKSEGVVGISNIFFPDNNSNYYWNGFLAQIDKQFPGRPVVGYEGGGELEYAKIAGCQVLGSLAIWVKT